MSIKVAERRLLDAARSFVTSGDPSALLLAAVEYGKAKVKGWRNRDRWKERKRLSSHG